MVRMSQRKDKESGINRQIPKRLCGRTQGRMGLKGSRKSSFDINC